jgi:hypothetical protein
VGLISEKIITKIKKKKKKNEEKKRENVKA